MLKTRIHLAAAWLAIAFSGCTSPQNNGSEAASQERLPARNISALSSASTWSGVIPCADCAGINTKLTLLPDGTWRRFSAYLGTGSKGDTVFTDFGRWSLGTDGSRIALVSSVDEPREFSIEPNGDLRMLDLNGDVIESALNYSLIAVEPAFFSNHPSRLTGLFKYMADAPIFVECRSGLQVPVDMSSAYLDLEKAYTALPGATGTFVPVRLLGHLEERAAMEGDGREVSLIVDSMDAVSPDDGCAVLEDLNRIASQEWKPVFLQSDSLRISVPEESRASFSLDINEGRVNGSGGCNRYFGSATMRGSVLVAQQVASTKMYCSGPMIMETEDLLTLLLTGLPSLGFVGDSLVWRKGPTTIAQFVAIPESP